ncbi:hypothetical protein IW140_006087 [Coemansia sp. RSA 1813]|nr:hypothetical protein EV178_006063 [Coemansia sp. RSA 1646]KAJ1766389.1 hypothetical protein LPJ74_005918 [Coemansia sp. RSA 1843]KAJ2085933.1 hypothetical protein IW138_006030 [Coemansia sp. RSA 986]KAJ2210210.1 hypothetical protein EV179_006387 [Coemansia sp. RSA 487]KAJ2563495.1 hypothetical protein IW140_006087 [Coemansia sp. RSA 1813]
MSLVEVSHYTIQLFGTNKYDGIRTSVFHIQKGKESGGTMEAAKMLELSAQSKYQHNMFVAPIEKGSNTVGVHGSDGLHYSLRCFSRTTEITVPPLWVFGAAPLVSHGPEKQQPGRSVYIVEGNGQQSNITELPEPSTRGHIQRAVVSIDEPYGSLPGNDALVHERIILTNVLGRPQSSGNWRDVQVDYINSHRTLVVYDGKMSPETLQTLAPMYASLTLLAIEQLNIDTVVVCAQHKATGGLLVRAFLPMQAYTEALMPVSATPYLRHPWAPSAVQSVFEISWFFDEKPCRIIKVSRQSATSNGSTRVELMARAEATLTRTIYV